MAKRKNSEQTVSLIKKMASEGKKRGEIVKAVEKTGVKAPVSSLNYYLYARPKHHNAKVVSTAPASRLKKILEADFLSEKQRIELALKELG